MVLRRPLFTSLLALSLALPGLARAEIRALLVGVSDYHLLDADLKGPANDVGLMAGALMARGADPASVTVLAAGGASVPAGIAAPADPTRAAILAALDALAAAAQPGDTVVFYFSGHGSQAPDRDGDEAGGYDEILLPSDASGWKGAIGAVENAIVDDELQPKMQAILDRGAQLVAILDACHSATGFRAVGGAGVARYVAPEALGIPEAAAAAAEGGRVAPPLTGDYVFLYSAQSDERAFEYPLGDPADLSAWYGDFTRNLAAALTGAPALSWAQALALAADGLRQEQASQTPDGEGSLLDAPVFGSAEVGARYRVEGGRLMAGLLAGLSDGAEVEIYTAAAGGEPLGTAVLSGTVATEAGLQGTPDLPAVAYAELRTPGRPPAVRLAAPVVATPGDHAAALAELERIAAEDLIDGAEWGTGTPDLGVVLDGAEIAVVGRDGVLDPQGPRSSPRLPADAPPADILAFLDRAVTAERLRLALAAASGRKGLTLPGAGLTVTAERVAAVPGEGDCEAAEAGPAPLADGGPVAHCDEVWLALKNGSATAQDVTVLYVDRTFGITPIWPPEGVSNRVNFGETAEVGLLVQNPEGLAGIEEILVIAVPAREGAPRTVLTGLAGGGVSRTAGIAPPVEQWLSAAVEAEGGSRTLSLSGKPDPVKVTRLRVALTPAGTE